MLIIINDEYKREKDIKEFAEKCPYKLGECDDIKTEGLYHLRSHCNQCFDEQKYNINNGRCFEKDNIKYIEQQKEANKYKEELAQNCKFAKKHSKTCNMKDTLEICNYCNKNFSR